MPPKKYLPCLILLTALLGNVLFLLWPLFFLLSGVLLAWNIKFWNKYKLLNRLILLVSILILLLKPIGFFMGLHMVIHKMPPKDVKELYSKMGIIQFTCYSDPGLFEAHLRTNRQKVIFELKQISSDKNILDLLQKAPSGIGVLPNHPDFYSEAEFFKYKKSESDAFIYSNGPDKIDNKGNLLYDSSNGTGSSGDLIHKIK